jgi:hypothetical protein
VCSVSCRLGARQLKGSWLDSRQEQTDLLIQNAHIVAGDHIAQYLVGTPVRLSQAGKRSWCQDGEHLCRECACVTCVSFY